MAEKDNLRRVRLDISEEWILPLRHAAADADVSMATLCRALVEMYAGGKPISAAAVKAEAARLKASKAPGRKRKSGDS